MAFLFLFVLLCHIYIARSTSIFQDSFMEKSGGSNEPEFVEDIKNVTVASGREAVISCVVANLGKYKVGWIRAEDQTILTLDSKVVTHNSRISTTFDGFQVWNLHIRSVKESDRGCYMCQINTAIMKKQLGCIDVHVSPTIIDEDTSADVTAREGDNITLVCRATGRPAPKIIWKREDGGKILIRRGTKDAFRGYDNITGETLHFTKADRRMQGAHFCLASNGVPPTKSKRIVLDVNFPPMIKVPSQLLGAPFGSELRLVCEIEGMPKPFVYWKKNRDEMLIDGLGTNNGSTKYIIQETRVSYKVELSLRLKNFSAKDVGIYYCVASNSLGKAEGTIRLNEVRQRSTPRPTAKHTVTQGFATPPMNTATRSSTGHHHTNNNKETRGWTTYDVDTRNQVVSAHDPRSVNRDDISSPMSAAAASIKTPPLSHLHHQQRITFSLLLFILLPYFFTHHHQFPHFLQLGVEGSLLLLLSLIIAKLNSMFCRYLEPIISRVPSYLVGFAR